MGTSSSLLPQSSSYLHCRRPPPGKADLPAVSSSMILASGLLGPWPEVWPRACAFDHSSLVPVSKKPEHWANISLCSMYLFSWPSAFMIISTSPVCAKFGNSFCGLYETPPVCERVVRWRRVLVLRDVTEAGRWTRGRSGGCGWETMGTGVVKLRCMGEQKACSSREFQCKGSNIRAGKLGSLMNYVVEMYQ